MPISFPTNPADNDTHVIGSITYQYNATDDKWTGLGISPSDRLIEGSNSLEIDASNNLIWTGNNVGIGTNSPEFALEVNEEIASKNANKEFIGINSINNEARIRSSFYSGASGAYRPITFYTSDEERLRIDSDGRLLIGTQSLINTSVASNFQIASNFGPRICIARNDTDTDTGNLIGALDFYGNHTATAGGYELVGRMLCEASENHTDASKATDLAFYTCTSGTDSATEKLRITSAGLVNITGGIQVTENVTPTSGRGIEIFEASAGVGQIQSYNRTSTSWDELNIKGSEVKIYSGTNNTLRFEVMTDRVKVHGSTDGVLELDTTDGRGSFIRFQENGTTKGWAGCSEGLGTGGDQDDFGIRAVGGFRVKTGSANRIEISDEGKILFRPSNGGFTTAGAASTYPGAAVAIDCDGIGAGTGTNIPNYGLYVDAVASSNDASMMTGLYTIAKQNTEGSSIGVHGLYKQDWNSYSRKIGGLFQAPARAPRYSTLSMNPGGGSFMNTTDVGDANKLTPGGNRPDGAADGGATYGDATALWGDVFRSDTDTSNELVDAIAIKATNRSTHARRRVGLLVGMVDGNDNTDNRKNTQFVEYYTNSSHQRSYARNDKKEVNVHYPLLLDGNGGTRNTTYAMQTGKYYYQKDVGANEYSWYFFNCYGASYARCGRLWIDITWSTGHASGVGEGTYSVAYTIHHNDHVPAVRRFTRFHEYHVGGSFYGWSSAPHLDIFQCTSTGTDAGIYLRVRGHVSWGAYLINAIRIKADENDYGFSKESSFKFVSHTTPSDANTTIGAITISSPST